MDLLFQYSKIHYPPPDNRHLKKIQIIAFYSKNKNKTKIETEKKKEIKK